MKIQILSDLHNEFLRNGKVASGHHWDGLIPESNADVIVLAGDIDTGTQGIQWAIQESERLSKPVIYVPGNHEYYHNEYFGLRIEMASLCDDAGVHCLDCGEFISDGVRIIGATLWTDYEVNTEVPIDVAMDFVENSLPDHRVIKFKCADEIRRFMPLDALSIHEKELVWLQKKLDTPFDGKTVVVTHHGPHVVCQHPGFPVCEITGAFHSDLSGLIERYDIDLWVYGHTHSNLDVVVSNTRIVSNQAGYPGENVTGFNQQFVLTI